MSLEIYPEGFHTRYEISHAISVSMSINYNDVGKIQLVVPASDYNIMALKNNAIIFDTDKNTTYVIVNTKCDTNENRITANGYTAEYILNKRCVSVKRQITNIEAGVYGLITDNLRSLPRVRIAPSKGYTETFQLDDKTTEDVDESVVIGGQLLDEIKKVLEYGELGRRMNWDSSSLSWEFEVFKGDDLTHGIHRVAFVEEQGTCSNLVINDDISPFKNVAYIEYEYNKVKKIVSVGNAVGNDRYEKWLNSSVTNEDGESESATKNRALANATMELAKYNKRTNFSVTIAPEEFNVRFSLGDIVSCVSNRFGVSFDARITGIKYTLDSTGERTEIILGEPTLTALGEMILNG